MGRNRYDSGLAESGALFHDLATARRIAQPPQHSPSVTDRAYRLISIYPTLCLLRSPLSANQVTILWVALGIAASPLLASARVTVIFAGAVLLQLSYLLDFVDGELARLKNQRSSIGVFLDLAGHGLVKAATLAALGFSAFRASGRPAVLVFAFAALIGAYAAYSIPYFAAEAQLTTAAGRRPRTWTRLLLKAPLVLAALSLDSPVLYLVVPLACLMGGSTAATLWYGFAAPICALASVVWHRHPRQQQQPRAEAERVDCRTEFTAATP